MSVEQEEPQVPSPSVLAVVVSYHPDPSIKSNVTALLEQVSQVVIIDNESSEQSTALFSEIGSCDRLNFIYNSINKGVGEAINQGLRWGLERNYEFFLLMDQDSCPTSGMVNELVNVARSRIEQGKLVIVGPHHEDFFRKIPRKNSSAPATTEPIPLLITSGCLISKKVLTVVGFYDERFFIDHIDHDYSIRVVRNGGKCLKVNSAVLLHKFGEARVRTFLGKSFFVQDYAPFRRYCMMRNRIILYKRYGMFREKWFWMDLRSAAKDLIKLLFFESKKGSKLMAIARGFWDGMFWV